MIRWLWLWVLGIDYGDSMLSREVYGEEPLEPGEVDRVRQSRRRRNIHCFVIFISIDV